MSELHKFLFDGQPVRGAIVRLTDAWTEMLRRRQANTTTGAYPVPVSELLGEMAAAGVLMQSGIKFNGALVLQIFGDGPVKLAVAEVQSDLSLRATATLQGAVPADAVLGDLVNLQGGGRCAITLDPKDKFPGQQPYQGVVPLVDAQGRIVRQVYGESIRPGDIGEPLKLLLNGTPVEPSLALESLMDRVRILCTVYDPKTGQYRVDYTLPIQIAGGITFLIAMLLFFLNEWRSVRRNARSKEARRA